MPAEREALSRLGVRFELQTRVDPRALLGEVDAIFVGVGLGPDRPLDCPGSDLDGVWESLRFVEALKLGEPPSVGERVVVIGGGNTAVDVARESLRLGAHDVTVAYRRTRELMPAYPFEVAEAESEGVVFEWLVAPRAIYGTTRVGAVCFERLRLGAPDADGRATLQPTGELVGLEADTVIAAIGQAPRRELAEWLALPNVFAGGDATNGGESVVQAVADGKRAARAIEAALCAG